MSEEELAKLHVSDHVKAIEIAAAVKAVEALGLGLTDAQVSAKVKEAAYFDCELSEIDLVVAALNG